MALKKCLLEIGTGIDLHGSNYTTAAQRAVRDAIQHNSLYFVRTLGAGPDKMQVDVTVAIPHPEAVNQEEVAKTLPFGKRSVKVIQGGMEIPSLDGADAAVIANAAVIVSLDL